jgi:CRP/FNR family transcriptional regulator, cyclic AMP receptor protein
MILRFEGSDGRRRLIDALCSCSLVLGDTKVAKKIAKCVELQSYKPGSKIIEQGGSDNDLYFIISGKFAIEINNRYQYAREQGQHVGEMALIDPKFLRSANVVAEVDSVVAKISEKDFTKIANRSAILWRRLAIILAERFRRRTESVQIRREHPILFIGSSKEALKIAETVKDLLACVDFEIRIWSEDVFSPSEYALGSLQEQLDGVDFALLIVNPDDKTISRGKDYLTPRDNIILELGLFIGALGRKRTLFLRPRGIDLKIPSDLYGLTPLYFENTNPAELAKSLADSCQEIRKIISKYGGI